MTKGFIVKNQNSRQESVYKSKRCGLYKVLRDIDSRKVLIKFLLTGYECEAWKLHAKNGSVKDKLYPSVYGVGFIGEGDHKPSVNGKNTKCYISWSRMLERCYSAKLHKKYPTYSDCVVCEEWHSFQNFASWYKDNYVKGCHLDKDIKIKGNKVYSPKTCSFVTARDNVVEANAKKYKFSKLGVEVDIFNLREFCNKNNLSEVAMRNVFNGKIESHSGWYRC